MAETTISLPFSYRPYRSLRVIGWMLAVILIWSIFVDYALVKSDVEVLEALPIIALQSFLLFMCVYFFVHSRDRIDFTECGFVVRRFRAEPVELSNASYRYVYTSQNYKGGLCWILSPRELTDNEVKHLRRKEELLFRYLLEGCLVIPRDPFYDSKAVSELLKARYGTIIDKDGAWLP